jgi:regulator of chromosome condensation
MPVKKKALKRRATGSSTGLTIKNKKQKLSLSHPKPTYIKTPGSLLTFSQGDVGQLGLGTNTLKRTHPALLPSVDNIMHMSAEGMHTVCLTESGEVITFGCNVEGALAHDTSKKGSETEPGKVLLEGCEVQITAGYSQTAALLSDGVYAWGSFWDSSGTMGLSSKGRERKPTEIYILYISIYLAYETTSTSPHSITNNVIKHIHDITTRLKY